MGCNWGSDLNMPSSGASHDPAFSGRTRWTRAKGRCYSGVYKVIEGLTGLTAKPDDGRRGVTRANQAGRNLE